MDLGPIPEPGPPKGIVKLRPRLTEQADDGPSPSCHGYRFPPEINSHAVWPYHRFCLSFRDVEDLLAQRITVSYETVRQWCQTCHLPHL